MTHLCTLLPWDSGGSRVVVALYIWILHLQRHGVFRRKTQFLLHLAKFVRSRSRDLICEEELEIPLPIGRRVVGPRVPR